MNNENRSLGFEKVAILILAALLVPSMAAALDYDFSADSSEFNNTQANFTVEELEPSTDYVFEGVRENGTVIEKEQFATTSQGRARFGSVLSPDPNDIEYIERRGWRYQVRNLDNGTVRDMTLFWGFDFHFFDTFYDGVIDRDSYTIIGSDSEEESGGQLKAFDDEVCVRHKISRDLNSSMRLKIDRDDDQLSVKVHDTQTSCENGNTAPSFDFQAGTLNYELDKSDPIDVFPTEQGWAAEYTTQSGGRYTETVGVSDEEVWISVDALTLYLGSVEIVPTTPQKDTLGALNPVAQMGSDLTGATLYEWEDFDTSTSSGNAAGIEWNDGAGWTGFFSDLEPSQFLKIRKTQNETVNRYTQYSDGLDIITAVSPDNGENFGQGSPIPFRFTPSLPDGWDGYASLQISPDPFDFTPTVDYDPSDCLEGFDLITTTCNGETLGFGGEDGLEIDDPDRYSWRFKFNTSSDTEDPVNEVYYTSFRFFDVLAAAKDVSLISPEDGTTLLTAKPEFVIEASSEISTEVRLYIDGSLQKKWSVEEGFSGRLRHQPDTGLSEGSHSWYAEIGTDDVVTSSTNSFTVNTSLADDYNFTRVAPPDGYETKERELDLVYNANVTEGGELNTILNQNSVDTRTLSSGSYTNLTTELSGLEVDEYDWYLLYNTTNYLVQSKSWNFEVLEDVTIKAVSPEDGANIDQPPIIFKSNLTTSSPGTVRLYIDDEVVGSKSVDRGFDGIVDIKVDELDSGKHAWYMEFTSDSTGNTFATGERTFDLAVGTEVEDKAGGVLVEFSHKAWGDLFGTDPEGSAMITAMMFVVLIAIGGTVSTGSSAIGGFVGLITYIIFGLINWLPRWTLAVVVVLAAYLFARKIAETGSPFGGRGV